MSKKYKVGVVGLGGIYKAVHEAAWMDQEHAEIVAVSDVREDRAKETAERLGIERYYTDYEQMLTDGGFDIVAVCTPNLYHSKVSVAALKAGYHVFCEKPDAVTVEEALKMKAAAEESGKLLMTMRNNRFNPYIQFLKQFADEGKLGEVYTGRCGWVRRRGIPGKGGWFTTKELSGGGPLIDLGVHMIDVATWIMGNPKPVAVSGATYRKFANNQISDSVHSQFGDRQADDVFDVEDLATGFIRFDNGVTLQIEFSWASNIGEETNFVELRGTKAGACFKAGGLEIFTETAGQLVDLKPVIRHAATVKPHAENIKHFINCLNGKATPTITPEHGVDMIRILTAIYQSAQLGREVQV